MKREYNGKHSRKSPGHTEHTAFGLAVKSMRGEFTIKKMASAIGYSEGYVSEIETGKRPPELDFIVGCVKCLNLGKDDTIKLFETAFASSDEVVLSTKYFQEEWQREVFAKIFTLLLLMPFSSYSYYPYSKSAVKEYVTDWYKMLKQRENIIDLAAMEKDKQPEKTENNV